ncbi:MAG: hypothetical protein JXR33_10555 [Coriobacteriia bacterium]|nr:hypothetical protein [Coriobacteriia bacterium]
MTDEYGIPGPDAPAPLPVDVPAPLPVDVPVRKRSKWPLIIGIGVVAFLMAACAGTTYLVTTVFQDAMDAGYDPAISPSYGFDGGQASVQWSGSGSYAVIQYFDEQQVPVVVVWDKETETTRREVGYVVVAVESAGAQIWLEPMDEAVEVYDSFDDPIDHKPAQLLAWKLDENEGPQDAPAAKWRAWPGPGGYTAYLELDPLAGCMPAKLLLNNNEGSGEGVKAALPESTGTFAPVGWSPSGEYFAVEELVDGEQTGLLGDFTGLTPPEQPDRKLLVFSAKTGELVAEAVLPRGSFEAPVSLWGDDDTLYWGDSDASQSSMDGTEPLELKQLAPGGTAQDVANVTVDQLSTVWSFVSLGSDESGALFFTDEGRLWRLGTAGLTHAGNISYADTGDWDPLGGLLVTRTEWVMSDDDSEVNAPQVFLLDEHGANERRIWRGPEIAIDYGLGY